MVLAFSRTVKMGENQPPKPSRTPRGELTVGSLVRAHVVDVLKLPERLDDVEVLPGKE